MTIKVVLVEPQNPSNIGAVARVMKNFDFKDLIIISPQTAFTEETYRLAMHAQEIIDNTTILASIEELIPTVSYIIGTTAILSSDRGSTNTRIAVSSDDPRLINIFAIKEDVAILFGREDSGLTNKELDICDMTIHIPTSKSYLALNLAQAVGIILYSLSSIKKPGIRAGYREANVAEKEKLIDWIKKLVSVLDFDDKKEEILVRRFKNILGRAFISGKEATSLLAIFSRSHSIVTEYQKLQEQQEKRNQ